MIRPLFIVLMFSLLLPFHACTKEAPTESTSEAPTEIASEAPTESASEEEEAPTKKHQ